MWSITPDNTPIRPDPKTGTPLVKRDVRPVAKKPAAVLTQEEAWVRTGFAWLRFVSAALFLPVFLPCWYMWQQTRRYVTPPPGAYTYLWPTFITAAIPGALSSIGWIAWVLQQIARSVHDLPTRIPKLWYPNATIFLAFAAPTWAIVALYMLRLAAHDRQAMQAAQHTAKTAKATLLAQITAGATLVLGQVRERTWDSATATWQIGPVAPSFDRASLCYLTLAHLMRHLLIVAPTRAGKTANLIRPLIAFCVRNRIAALFFDPKGNDLNPKYFHYNFSLQEAEAANSFRLCLIDPSLSPQKAIAKLAEGLIAETTPPYFSNAARNAFTAIMLLHYAIYGEYCELSDVLAYRYNTKERERLVGDVRKLLSGVQDSAHPFSEKANDRRLRLQVAQDALLAYAEMAELAGSKNDPLGTMGQAITALASGQYMEYVTTNPNCGKTVERLLTERKVTRFAFTTDDGETGRMVGRIVIRLYTDYVLSPRATDSYLKLIVIDEAHNYICPALTEGIPQSAGRNAGYVLALQSLYQIKDETARQIIYSNCKNRIAIAGIEYRDALTFSQDWGKVTVETRSYSQGHSESTNRGASHSMSGGMMAATPGSSRGNSTGTSAGESMGESRSMQLRETWLPHEISALPMYHAVARFEDGQTEAQLVLIRFCTPQEQQDRRFILPFPPVMPGVLRANEHASMPIRDANPNASHPGLPDTADTDDPQTDTKTGMPAAHEIAPASSFIQPAKDTLRPKPSAEARSDTQAEPHRSAENPFA